MRRLGQYVKSHTNLTILSESLTAFRSRLSDEGLKASFRFWQPVAQRGFFEMTKSSLVLEDHDFAADLVSQQWGNVAWIEDVFLPRLATAGTPAFISQLIGTLLVKDRQGNLVNAESLAEQILDLDDMLDSLSLGAVELHLHDEEAGIGEANRFLDLVEQLALSGFHGTNDELFRLSRLRFKLKGDNRRLVRWMDYDVGLNLVDHLFRSLSQAMAPTSKPLKAFVRKILTNYVSFDTFDLTEFPHDQGFKMVRRHWWCDCDLCEDLIEFFRADEESRVFEDLSGEAVKHFQSRTAEVSRTHGPYFKTFKSQVLRNGKYKLTVRKTGIQYAHDLTDYAKRYNEAQEITQRLSGAYAKLVLGSQLYGKLITFDHLPDPSAALAALAKATKAKKRGAAEAGVDREGEGGEVKRPKKELTD